MKRVLTIFLFTLMALVPAFAQDKAAAMPTVDQIIEKYYQSIGGKAAHEKLTSRVAKGTFDIPAMGAGGPFESYSKAPNKNIIIINIDGFGTVQQGFDGVVAWATDPQSGLREMQGAELSAAKRDADFFGTVKLKENFPKMTLTGKSKVGEHEVYVIEATTPEGTPEKFYFDTQTGLLLRVDSERESPQGKIKVESYLEDYKEVDGIKIPFTSRQNTEAMSFTLKFSEVKHNVSIEDTKFKRPAN
jgi:outer membrane lipoprotein-sorting protein